MTSFKNKLLPVSILLPTFNEQDVIEDVLNEWNTKVLKKIKGSEILIDDCSTDNTKQVILRVKKKIRNIKYNFNKKDGFQSSIIRMAKKAKNNLLFMTDSDGQYPVDSFWKLYKYTRDFHIVTGYKLVREDLLYRKFLSFNFNILVSIFFFFNLKNYDYNCFYKFIDKNNFIFLDKQIKFLRLRFPTTELYLLAKKYNLKIKRVAIKTFFRKYGKSNALPLSLILKIILPTIFRLIFMRINFIFLKSFPKVNNVNLP